MLLLHGTDDRVIPIDHSRRLMKRIANLPTTKQRGHLNQDGADEEEDSEGDKQSKTGRCTIRVKALENGDPYTGTECVRPPPAHSHSSDRSLTASPPTLSHTPDSPHHQQSRDVSLPVASLVEIGGAGHDELHTTREWLVVVPTFIRKVLSSDAPVFPVDSAR
jgi:hypothetical protein